MKVTLNSLRMLAWLLSRLRHACSGGAPPSKSNCSEVTSSQHPKRHIRPRETKRVRRERRRSQKRGSPAAARSGRRTPPPATSSSGSGRCCRSPSRPVASKCYLPLLTTDAILPAPRAADRGSASPWVPANPEEIRGPDALMRVPRGDRDPRRYPSSSSSPRAPADRFGALGIGWSRRARPRERRQAGAPAGLDRIQPVTVNIGLPAPPPPPPLLLFLFAGLSPRWWCAVESFSTSGEGARKSTAHALVPGARRVKGGGLRFWKRRRKWLQPAAYRPRAYEWG